MTKANNSALMRENNRRRIIDLVRKEARSRADIARATGLSRAAVTILTDSLLEEGIIMTGDSVRSESGRRPTLLYLDPDAFVSVGIDLCREGVEIVLTDFSANKIFERKIGFLTTADETTEAVCSEILFALNSIENCPSVAGVCICAPGPIDCANGRILNPSGLAMFHNYDIKQALQSRLSMPVYLEKDTNVLAVAEMNNGNADGDMLFLLADHGIGCSIVKDGHLFTGRNGMGGELGHTTIDINGDRCSCGKVGCAELYASVPATVKKYGADSWEKLISDAKSGDTSAIEALCEQARILSVLCVNAVNLFEPHNIVLGGMLTDADFILNEIMENSLKNTAFSRNVHSFGVLSSTLGKNARAYAAAVTALEYYFNGGIHL